MSRFGKISLRKINTWSKASAGFGITPYMQSLMLYTGQKDNYKEGENQLRTYLRVEADDSQINRLCNTYGTWLEQDKEERRVHVEQRAIKQAQTIDKEEIIYAMLDGTMLHTREDGGSWKEMKLGRVFKQSDHYDLGNKPNIIKESMYVSHFGGHASFTNKFEKVVDCFEQIGPRLVFINDGATWINNWITTNYSKATNILDYYHAVQYIHDFAKIIWKNKKEQDRWISKQKMWILNDGIEKVIANIKKIETKSKVKQTAKTKIVTYYTNNKDRMYYKTYRERGLLIGSGPIESAHRFVLHKRMKQSGQKWTISGGQAVANLRIANLNGQWDEVIKLIQSKKSA